MSARRSREDLLSCPNAGMCRGTAPSFLLHIACARIACVLVACVLTTSSCGDDAPVAPASTGHLLVVSEPSRALVYVDDVPWGPSPVARDDVAPGRHRIRLYRSGYRVWEDSVDVEAARTVTVTAELVPSTGSLRVATTPEGASVFLDGGDTGSYTPALLEGYPAGEHRLEFELAGYLTAVIESVRIAEDSTTEVNATLRSIPAGEIAVNCGGEILRMLTDGTRPVSLAAGARTFHSLLSGSPGGEWMVFERADGRLAVIDRAGGAIATLGWATSAEWAPDGGTLVYGNYAGLFRFRIGGGAPTPILASGAGTSDLSPSYSTSGDRIAYVHRAFDGRIALRTIAAEGSDPTTWFETTGSSWEDTSWTAWLDGLRFLAATGDAGLFLVDTSTGSTALRWPPPCRETRLSPDRRWLFLVGSGDARHLLDVESGASTELPFEPFGGEVAWAPDSRSFALSSPFLATGGIHYCWLDEMLLHRAGRDYCAGAAAALVWMDGAAPRGR